MSSRREIPQDTVVAFTNEQIIRANKNPIKVADVEEIAQTIIEKIKGKTAKDIPVISPAFNINKGNIIRPITPKQTKSLFEEKYNILFDASIIRWLINR